MQQNTPDLRQILAREKALQKDIKFKNTALCFTTATAATLLLWGVSQFALYEKSSQCAKRALDCSDKIVTNQDIKVEHRLPLCTTTLRNCYNVTEAREFMTSILTLLGLGVILAACAKMYFSGRNNRHQH